MKLVWRTLFWCILSISPSPFIYANDAQNVVAQFFNMVTAALLIATAQENTKQKVAAATALIASMSDIVQTALKDEPQDGVPVRSFLATLHQRELQSEHEQID